MINRRILIYVMVTLSTLTLACKQEPFYRAGDAIADAGSIPIEQVKSQPLDYEGQVVVVEGMVNSVCQGSGCWALVEVPGSDETIYVKSSNHQVVLPIDSAGSLIRVQGAVVLEEAQAQSGCSRHRQQPGEAHACPQPDCFIEMTAVELYKNKNASATEG